MSTHAIIVGGGIIGLATAFEFQEAGFRVTLIDPDPISGATHHAGGMLAPTAEVQYQQQALAPLMQASAQLYPSLIRRVLRHTDLPTGYRTEGTLLVGADRADAAQLGDLVRYLSLGDIRVDPLSIRRARSLEPALAPGLAKAISIDDDHQVAPRLLARAMLDTITARGAEIIRDTVHSVDGHSPSRTLTCAGGVRPASRSVVVLSAGLGVAGIGGWFDGEHPLQLRPVYGDILNLRVPEQLRPLLGRVVRGFVGGRSVYLIPRDAGVLTIGATSREDRPEPNAGAVHDLLRDAIRLVPGVADCDFLEATCGARPGTPDDLPYLGWAGSNLIVSTGYFRHGILLAALAARSTVQLALQEQPIPDISACDPFRHAHL